MQNIGIIMMDDSYPFNSKLAKNTNYSKIICHKIISFNNDKTQRIKIMKKIKTLITHQFVSSIIIGIQSVVQQENHVNVFYQYIYQPANQWIYTLDTKKFYQIRQDIVNFAKLLTQFKIVTQLDFYNFGVTKDQKIKYYLRLDFQINQNLSKQHILSVYIKNINQIFQPIETQLRQQGKIKKKPCLEDKKEKLNLQNYMFLPTQFAPDEGDIIAPFSIKENNSSSNRQKSKSIDIVETTSLLRLTTKSMTKQKQMESQQNFKVKTLHQIYPKEQNNYLRKNIKPELLESIRSVGNDRKINNWQRKAEEQKQQRKSINLFDRQNKFPKKQPESFQDQVINKLKKQQYQNLKNAKDSYYGDFANILDNDQGQFQSLVDSKKFPSSKSIKSNQYLQLSIATQDSQRLIKQRNKQVKNQSKIQNFKIGQIQSIKGRAANAIQQSQKIMQKLRNMKIIKN